jgi:hypothetical protein
MPNRSLQALPKDYTYLLLHSREELLSYLPTSGVVAEIGVADGNFSQAILDRNRPRKLHLIDAWQHIEDSEYNRDPCNLADDLQQERYERVLKRFSRSLKLEIVKVHRAFSTDAAKDFTEGYFDWVYVDAMHMKEAVIADLQAYSRLVKNDGFLCGHDFADNSFAAAHGFGVVEGVLEFVRELGFHLIVVTNDVFPSYVIAKNTESASFHEFERRLMNLNFIKLRNVQQLRFSQEFCVDANGKLRKSYGVIESRASS